MGITESSRLYLENYYVLEQARTDAHIYLERIVTKMANEVEEYLQVPQNGEINFSKYVQKDGGYSEFIFDRKEPLPGIRTIDRWKFSIAYRDAMRSEPISSPTKCKVYCLSPKSYGKQNYELERMTVKLGLPDLFRVEEIDLMDALEDEVISAIKTQIIEFYNQFVQTVDALVEEGNVFNQE